MRHSQLMAAMTAALMPAPCVHGQAHLNTLVYQREGSLRLGVFDFDTSAVLENNQLLNIPPYPFNP